MKEEFCESVRAKTRSVLFVAKKNIYDYITNVCSLNDKVCFSENNEPCCMDRNSGQLHSPISFKTYFL